MLGPAANFASLLYVVALWGCATPQNEGDVRLTGGQNATEGRVEVFLSSQWYGVCDYEWSTEDAVVVCRQLNLPWSGALPLTEGGAFLSNDNRIYGIDNVKCVGDERQLLDCPHENTDYCNGQEGASVRCLEGPQPIYNNGSGEVRLVDGTGNNSGLVEINVNGSWTTVCNQFWSSLDARVVCRELGFNVTENSAVSEEIDTGAYPPLLVEKFLCLGNETRLSDCPHEIIDRPIDCFHAAVTCLPVITDVPEGSVRLVGSSMSGRLEILINNVWGTVCNYENDFTRYSADVVCKQLNFTNNTEGRVSMGAPGIGPIWLSSVSCSGNESSLLDCNHSSRMSNCIHDEDVTVTCYQYSVCRQGDIRLVDGATNSEGRVEMCYNDAWSTICYNNWDSHTAQQVCRQLNLPYTAALPYRSTFGQAVGNISYVCVFSCTDPNGRTVFDDCRYKNSSSCSESVVDVQCESAESLNADNIRLVGGRTPFEGRVEVLVGGEWGTICNSSGWNASAAATVCRQMGFPTNGSIALFGSAFGPAAEDQPMHFNRMQCTGAEAGPQACNFTMDLSGCSHASVICSMPPVPQAPENFQVQLNNLNCSQVTFSWTTPNNLQFHKLHHYRIKFGLLDTSSIFEVTIPISHTKYTLNVECGSSYFSYITTFLLNQPGADSNPAFFKTGSYNTAETDKEAKVMTTSTSAAAESSCQQARELSDGGLAASILVLLFLVAIIVILVGVILVLCARNQRKFQFFGFHSKSGSVYGTSNCVFENKLDSQSMESLDSSKASHVNGDSAGLIQS